MSVYDDMYDCIEGARSTDSCEYHVYSEMFDLIAEAEAENAKLRELVRDMFKALTTLDVDYCQACPRDTANGPCTFADGDDEYCSFARDMRDLGVEVDE